MNESSTSTTRISLRSGRVLSEDTRGRPRRRKARRTESAPPINHILEKPTPPEETMGDARNDQGPPWVEEELPLSHYSCPNIVDSPSCIVHPHPNVAYEIKHSILSILPTFHGVSKEKPYEHIIEFDAMCSTLNRGGLSIGEVKLRLFQFSLKDKAKIWFHKLKPRSILSWDDMQKVFLNAYYPHHRTTAMRHSLTNFFQDERETIYDAWERFKDLELGCPHHGISKWLLVSSFYNGLFDEDRRRLDNACGGSFQRKGPNAAWDIIEEISVQSGQWDNHGRRRESRGRDEYFQGGRGRNDEVSQVQRDENFMSSKLEKLEASLNKKIDLLLQVQRTPSPPSNAQVKVISSSCLLCEAADHKTQECHLAYQYPDFVEAHSYEIEQQAYPPRIHRYDGAQGFGGRNHGSYQGGASNYTHGGASTYQAHTPGFNAPQAQEPSMKEMLAALTTSQLKTNQQMSNLALGQQNLQQDLQKLEFQFEKLAKELSGRPQGALLSQVELNPRGKQHEQVNVISTLHSGRVYDNKVQSHPTTILGKPPSLTTITLDIDDIDAYVENGAGREKNVPSSKLDCGDVTLSNMRRNKGVDKEAGGEENVPTGGVSKKTSSSVVNKENGIPLGKGFGQLSLGQELEKDDHNKRNDRNVSFQEEHVSDDNVPRRVPVCVPPLDLKHYQVPLPFPQVRSREEVKKKQNKHRKEFTEMFKKVNINIPLIEAIKQFPPYAKFLKEMCTNKRKFTKDEQITLSEEVSAVLLGKLPPKLKDPGSFTVPCTIGNKGFEEAMLDLGASINLMPYHIYKTLSLDDIKPLKISLKMADQRTVTPRGVVEDVLVKIDDLLIPADFVVLDMKESLNGEENEIPIILGRPFMATAGTRIDVQKGILTMTVFDTTVGFRIFDAMRSPMPLGDCFRIDKCEQLEKDESTLMRLQFFEEYVKQYPPSSEAREVTSKASKRRVVGKANKKKKNVSYAWPTRLTPKFLKPSSCFGGSCSKTTMMGGKKESFKPP